MLRDKINDGMKEAMKSQDKLRTSTLRLVNAAIKNADIEARTAGKQPLTDDEVMGLMQKLIKQRQESVELYVKGGRQELADQERGEITIIQGFLPQQMGEPVSEYARRPAPQGLDQHGRPAPVAPAPQGDDHLDIPAFLRRQTN